MGRPILLEGHPRIRLAHLRQFGVFGETGKEVIEITIANRLFIFMRRTENLITVITSVQDRLIFRELDIVKVRVKFGFRWYFYCPWTGKRCVELHFIAGRFGSRESFGRRISAKNGSPTMRRYARMRRSADRLLGRDGRGPARGHNREKLIEYLRSQIGYESRDPVLNEQFRAHERRVRLQSLREIRNDQSNNPLSTQEALDCGSGMRDWPAYDQYRAKSGSEWLASGSSVAVPRPQPSIARIENRATLDIRPIVRRFEPERRLVSGMQLGWPVEATGGARLMLFVDFRDPDHSCLTVRSEFEVGIPAAFQVIRLIKAPLSRRWFMVCPVDGKHRDLLYFRDGIFASAAAHRLIYSSQRALLR